MNKHQPPFTVVLLYPDDEGTWVGHVHAMTPDEALANARKQVFLDNGWSLDPDDAEADPDDLKCIAIFRGHHDDCSGSPW